MMRSSLCAGAVWVEGVQPVYLPGQEEVWLEVGDSYNQPKSKNAKVFTCPPEKGKAITAVLEHFQMLEGSSYQWRTIVL